MSDIVIQIFAGIGLFFVGITLLSNNIKKIGSKHAPKVIATLAKNDIQSAFAGIVSGVITNSGKAVTFTLVGLVEAGLISFRKSLPIIIGGSIGSAFIVLWASFNFDNVVYILLGIAGLYFQFGDRKNPKTKVISGILLGFGLLFYGLAVIKIGAAPIKSMPWFEHYIALTQGHWFFALFIGAVLALVSQSGSSVAIIAISLVNTGILGVNEAIMLVFGTNVGSGISTALLGLGLGGLSRRLVMFHGFFKAIGIIVMVPLLYWEVYGEIPLLKNFVSIYSTNASMQIALIYLMYELITALFVGCLLNSIAARFSGHATLDFPLQDFAVLPKLGITDLNDDILVSGVDIQEQLSSINGSLKSVVNSSDVAEGLQVSILYTPGNQHDPLSRALELYNIRVVEHREIDSEWRSTLEKISGDILLVILDDGFNEHDELMYTLMEESRMPVLFNDGLFPHTNLSDLHIDWVRSLVQKLHHLAGRTQHAALFGI